MPNLSIGQTSDCDNALLDLYTRVNGVVTDMYSVEFVIVDRVTTPGTDIQIFPPSGRQAVDLADCPGGDKIGTGHYNAAYTVAEGTALGTHAIIWYFRFLVTSTEHSFTQEFEVIPAAIGSSDNGYCTIAELRAEGVPDSVTDAEVTTAILIASAMVDKYTQRFFTARSLTINVDGGSTPTIFLEQPIISVSALSIDGAAQDLDDYVIYNRHITSNLLSPDDRENPRIEVGQNFSDSALLSSVRMRLSGRKFFPLGQQNIQVTGVFGYTDYDGTATGKTPDLICEATKLLAIRELPDKYTADPTDESFSSHRITGMRTRDQRVQFADPNKLGLASPGPYTGDRRIDNILMMYAAPPRIGAV